MHSPLDSRRLQAFVILARTGSFTETARELSLSQSAVSHAMKALEEEVRCRLLDRVGKTVTLTQAGEQLLEHAEKILAEMENARAGLADLGKWGRGRLRIGASPTACQFILPAVLRELKESFPQCAVQIEPGDASHTLDLLRINRIDLALVPEPRKDPQFEFLPLFEDDLHFLVSPLHPWAAAGKVERTGITKQQFILYTRSSYLVQMIEAYFREEDIILPTSIELGNMEAIKELVKLGLGISILAPWVARKELAERSLIALPLGKRKLKRRWGMLTFRGRGLNLVHQTFVGLCKAVTANMMKGSAA